MTPANAPSTKYNNRVGKMDSKAGLSFVVVIGRGEARGESMVNFTVVIVRAERRVCPRPDNDDTVASVRRGRYKNSEEQAQA